MSGTDLTSSRADEVSARVAELDALRRRLINVVGHELRTPVTTLHGLSTELLNTDSMTVVREIIGPAMVRNAERLTALLDDLLIASGIPTAIPVDSPGEVEVGEEIQRVWAHHSGESLDLAGPPVFFSGPIAGLKRTLQAVLDNAAAYGTAPPAVAVTESDGSITITVFSPGPTMHPEEVALATEPFFRGERAVTTQPGLGMGLAIAKAVAQGSGGHVTFAAANGGTRTTIELPRGRR